MDVAFLIVRLVLGLYIAAHGTQKLLGWFGGPGLAGAGGFFEQLGFRPGRPFALMASLGEIAGGLLTLLGLGGALGPALIVMLMLVAIFAVHIGHGLFAQESGVELPVFYIIAALAVAFAGSGAYSLDRALGLAYLLEPVQVWIAMGVAVVLAGLNLMLRKPANH